MISIPIFLEALDFVGYLVGCGYVSGIRPLIFFGKKFSKGLPPGRQTGVVLGGGNLCVVKFLGFIFPFYKINLTDKF